MECIFAFLTNVIICKKRYIVLAALRAANIDIEQGQASPVSMQPMSKATCCGAILPAYRQEAPFPKSYYIHCIVHRLLNLEDMKSTYSFYYREQHR